MRKLFLLVAAVVIVIALVLGLSLSGTKAPQEGTPTEAPQMTPEATATPEPTAEPIVIELSEDVEAAQAEAISTASEDLKDLVISDADVDAVMIEDVHAWQGFSVKTVEYEQQTIFYVIADDIGSDETNAIGAVIMSYNTDMVNSLNCQVYLDSIKKNEDKIRKLYDYFLNTFPVEVVGNLDVDAWMGIRDVIHMDFDSAAESAASGTETRDLCGQFVFHVANSLISLDFYVE